ncbi:hypothetical protein ACU4GD_07575 [Cupriavidus basilensis]
MASTVKEHGGGRSPVQQPRAAQLEEEAVRLAFHSADFSNSFILDGPLPRTERQNQRVVFTHIDQASGYRRWLPVFMLRPRTPLRGRMNTSLTGNAHESRLYAGTAREHAQAAKSLPLLLARPQQMISLRMEEATPFFWKPERQASGPARIVIPFRCLPLRSLSSFGPGLSSRDAVLVLPLLPPLSLS